MMKKIEQRVINAFRDQSEFKAGNTEVVLQQAPKVGYWEGVCLLHGNLIATFDRALNQLEIEDGGWQSVTTKSRLNALLSEFAPAYRIVQRNWEWFLDDRSQDDETLIPWTGSAVFRAGTLKSQG